MPGGNDGSRATEDQHTRGHLICARIPVRAVRFGSAALNRDQPHINLVVSFSATGELLVFVYLLTPAWVLLNVHYKFIFLLGAVLATSSL